MLGSTSCTLGSRAEGEAQLHSETWNVGPCNAEHQAGREVA